MIRNTFIAAAVCVAALPAAAQSHWYVGFGAGQSRTDRELVANRESTITTATNLHTDFDARDTAWKLFGGYRFNSIIALEGGIAHLGTHSMLTRMQGGDPPAPAAILVDRKISGYGIDLLASPPLGWANANVFARVGAFRSRLEAHAALSGNIIFTSGDSSERSRTTRHDETILKYGLGGEYLFRPDAAVRLEWERYVDVGKAFAVGGTGTTGEASTDVFSLALVMRF
jgi:OOP family OmpA-OmpF porin